MNRQERRARPVGALSDVEIAAMLRGLVPMNPKVAPSSARYAVRSSACVDCKAWRAELDAAPSIRELQIAKHGDRSMPQVSPIADDEPVADLGGRRLCRGCAADRALLGRLRRRALDVGAVVRALDAIAVKKLSALDHAPNP